MAIKMQQRRDTAANWTSTNPTLAQWEIGYETDTKKAKIGDGSTAWTSLAYAIFKNIPLRSVSANTTFTASDAGSWVLHPAADTTARVFTIDSNANLPFEVGTTITIPNENGAGAITIAITSDTLVWSPSNATGSRTLASGWVATIFKITTTKWMITGTGLT